MTKDLEKIMDKVYLTPFEELYAPALEYMNSPAADFYHPEREITSAVSDNCKTLADIIQNCFGNRNYSDYKGAIADKLFITAQDVKNDGSKSYICRNVREKAPVGDAFELDAKGMVRTVLKDILIPLSELNTSYIRTNPKRVFRPWEKFLFTPLSEFTAYIDKLTNGEKGTLIKSEAAAAFSAYIEDSAEKYFNFDKMELGELLGFANLIFMEYDDDSEKILMSENLVTSVLIMPYIYTHTNIA